MISVLHLGHCDYATALRLQQALVALRQQGSIPNVLLFVEHPPVITLGRNARASNIVAPRELLAVRGVEVHEINRGGDVTFHGPGQLVAYPIFDLRSFTPKLGAVDYVRRLEAVLMRTCAQYRIETQRIPGLTGLWTLPTPPPRLIARATNRDYTPAAGSCEQSGALYLPSATGRSGDSSRVPDDPAGGPHMPSFGKCGEQDSTVSGESDEPPYPERKIAAIGVHIARGVTSHGFALNVTTALEYFQLIVPCGLARPVTSIEFETGLRPSLEEVSTHASRSFGELFGSQMLWLESIHDLLPAESAALEPAAPGTIAAAEPAPAKANAPASSKPSPADSLARDSAPPSPTPEDTPARAPENERRIAGDDFHLA